MHPPEAVSIPHVFMTFTKEGCFDNFRIRAGSRKPVRICHADIKMTAGTVAFRNREIGLRIVLFLIIMISVQSPALNSCNKIEISGVLWPWDAEMKRMIRRRRIGQGKDL